MTELVALAEHFERTLEHEKTQDYQAYVSPITTVTGAETKGTFFFILNHNPETDPRTRHSFPQDVCLPCKQAGHWKRVVCFSVSLPVSLLPLGQSVSPLKEAQNRSCVLKKKRSSSHQVARSFI